jgi:hypothetical protein
MAEVTEQHLEIWTVYDHPSDYQDKFVARKSLVTAQGSIMTHEMFVADSLVEIRMLLPPGLARIPRYENDDPVIVECWL